MPELPPAGWYDDGTGAPTRRWWDGERWTGQYETPQTPSSPDPEPASPPANLGGRHGAAAAAVATASAATAGVATARGSVAVALALRSDPEIVAEQGLAPMGETWRAGGATAAVITRDPLPNVPFAPPEPATAAQTTQWVENLELVRMHNPQAVLGTLLGVISIVVAPLVTALLPQLSAALPSLTGLGALALGVAAVLRGRWSGAGRGLAILALAAGLVGIVFAVVLRSGMLPELVPPIGPLSSLLG